MDKFYITTAIDYTNAKPHIGHALEKIQADVLARYNRGNNNEVFFLTGTDEHGAKIAKAAKIKGEEPKEFTDEISGKFTEMIKALNISNDDFIRTTDSERHWPGVYKIWNALEEKGDLYKGSYEGLYCEGHEAFMKKSDLKNGICPDHKLKPEKIKEENYFFKLSKYKDTLNDFYKKGVIKISPESRVNEVLGMLKDSEDISFSRPSKDLKWGIPVPGDPDHTIYVWADALTNYLSGIGYGRNNEWQKWWPANVQVIGKDILRFHAIIWPAMLISAGLETPKHIHVHGFITVDGEKMSKTLGNVIDPIELSKRYGADAVRYFLLREIPSTEDGDFSYIKLEERYNGDLANNLGNLISRTAKLIETRLNGELNFENKFIDIDIRKKIDETLISYKQAISEFRLHEALARLWELLSFANSYIDLRKPWIKDKDAQNLLETLTSVLSIILNSARMLKPFMPETADRIFKTFGSNKNEKNLDNYKFSVGKIEPLFPRLK